MSSLALSRRSWKNDRTMPETKAYFFASFGFSFLGLRFSLVDFCSLPMAGS